MDAYTFHQTPIQLAKDIITKHDNLFKDGDILYEPFKGEGAFFDNFPTRCKSIWSEITQGKDYTSETEYDWVITNPPFRLEGEKGRRNCIWELIDYFSTRVKKGLIFLVNDYGLCTLTPNKQKILSDRGFGLTHLTMCNVKKWRGRYFIIVFQPTTTPIMDFLSTTY